MKTKNSIQKIFFIKIKMATNSHVSESSSSEENKRFRWVVNVNDEKVVNLFECITHYKTALEKNKMLHVFDPL